MIINKKSLFGIQKIEPITFLVTTLIVGVFFTWALAQGDHMAAAMSSVMDSLTDNLGGLYLLMGVGAVGVAIFYAFGPYSHIKLGKDDDVPEHSYFTWFSMLFAAGYGVGLVYWGAAEPIIYFLDPPHGIEPSSAYAAELGLAYSFFHWGLMPWAINLSITIPMGYFIHRMGYEPRFSSALQPILGEKANSAIGNIIDGFLIVGLLGSLVTVCGLGSMQIAAGLNTAFNIPITPLLYVSIGGLLTLIIMVSSLSGIKKGIALLSDINIPVAFIFMFIVFLIGNTQFSMELGLTAFGEQMSNFIHMSFWLDPIDKSGFPQNWTVFYWAWWLATVPLMGLFVPTISKGRTIRQVTLTILFVPPVASWVWFAVFGGNAIFIERTTGGALGSILANQGPESIMYAVIEFLPLSEITNIIFLIVTILFLVTTGNSSSYACAQITTKRTADPMDPPAISRGFFAIIMGGGGLIMVLFGGGLSGLQTSTIVTSVFIIPVLIAITVSFIMKMRKEENRDKLKESL